MVIKIEVEHAVKSGREREVLSIIRELNRRGQDYPADALWKELLLHGVFPDEESGYCVKDNFLDLYGIKSLLACPARIKLLLSS